MDGPFCMGTSLKGLALDKSFSQTTFGWLEVDGGSSTVLAAAEALCTNTRLLRWVDLERRNDTFTLPNNCLAHVSPKLDAPIFTLVIKLKLFFIYFRYLFLPARMSYMMYTKDCTNQYPIYKFGKTYDCGSD